MNKEMPQMPENQDQMVKWSALAVFALVVLGSGYAIYSISQSIQQERSATTNTVASTPTPSPTDIAAQGSPAPLAVTSSSDLTAADQSLDSSDIDSVTSDLSENDSDLAAF